MVTHVSGRETQFSYFDQMLAGLVWKGGKTLNFGGNMGGFLAGAGNHVDHGDGPDSRVGLKRTAEEE